MQQYSTYHQNDLLQKIASGDEHAFSELYNFHWKKVYTFLFRMTRSRQIAEELMMDIFTKLWLRRDLVININDIDAYLLKSSYHKALNFFRYTARQKKLQDALLHESAINNGTIIADSTTYLETRELINEAIDHLSPQRKVVFNLGKVHRLSNNEIARELNISPATVKKTMSSALKAVKGFLKERGIEATTCIFFFLSFFCY
ncbi:MAG: sigma-70 family RNA polymerase sigma factor [Chitinophagaceae bacterium]|nr:sigma-70 family RNA polymerase sigma factor [Chitinophagaceae bacterium]